MDSVKIRTIRGFDLWSSTYTETVGGMLNRRGYGYNELAQFIEQRLTLPLGSLVVELGTGTGILGHEFKKLRDDVRIIGLDISSGMLRRAQNTMVYHDLVRCDAERIPLRQSSVRALYSTFMFHSIMNPRAGLRSLYETLQPGGTAIVVDLFRIPFRIPVVSIIGDALHSMRHEFGALSYYLMPIEFARLAMRVGFRVQEQTQLGKYKKYTHFAFVLTKDPEGGSSL